MGKYSSQKKLYYLSVSDNLQQALYNYEDWSNLYSCKPKQYFQEVFSFSLK